MRSLEGVSGATGSAFPLGAFEAAIRDDAEVVGALYTGSLGDGTADRFSDLDIEVWVTDAAFSDPPRVMQGLMELLGPVQFLYERGDAHFVTGFVGPDWQRVDLELHGQGEMLPSARYSAARVVKDSDRLLARLVAEAPVEGAATGWLEARAAIEEAIDSQIYLALHNARGAVWSAMGEISYRCAELYTLLALLRGRRSYGFRYVEELQSAGETEMMRDAWPGAPERDEVRRAARALWCWTRYVWDEAERQLGGPLGVRVDEDGLLAAVDRIYAAGGGQ